MRELNAFLPSHDTLLSPNEVQEWLSIRETLLEKKSTYADLQSKLLDMETQHDADVTDRFNRLCNGRYPPRQSTCQCSRLNREVAFDA